jgi:hypothetical protein
MPETPPPARNGPHGGSVLPRVRVDSYNLELKSKDGFIGDRASKRAFAEILEDWREKFRRIDDDPLGDEKDISKKKLDETLINGDPEAAGVVHGAIEDFAQEFAPVTRRFMRPNYSLSFTKLTQPT